MTLSNVFFNAKTPKFTSFVLELLEAWGSGEEFLETEGDVEELGLVSENGDEEKWMIDVETWFSLCADLQHQVITQCRQFKKWEKKYPKLMATVVVLLYS